MKRKYKAKDFTYEDMPCNRWQVFLDIIKLHWRTILFLGLMLLLFSLPLYGFSFYIDFKKASLSSAFNSSNIDEETFINSIKNLEFIYIAILPICLSILSIGLAGIIRIIKRLCYIEPVFLLDDFKKGIKQNIKLYILLFLALSFINFITIYLYKSFPNNIASYIPLGLAVTLIYPVFLIMLVVIPTYNVNFSQAISNSYKIYFRSFFIILGIGIVVCSPVFFNLITDVVLKYLLISLVGMFLIITSKLDKYINKTMFPQLYDKGVKRKQK